MSNLNYFSDVLGGGPFLVAGFFMNLFYWKFSMENWKIYKTKRDQKVDPNPLSIQ